MDSVLELMKYPNGNSSCGQINNQSRNLKTLDEVMDLKNFPILYSTLTDKNMRNSIRLLRIFGVKGCKVIFATNADKVYGYGLNRDGSLGLGTYEEHIRKPQLNEVLSGKRIVDIAPGFEHCLALTASGQVYGWGQNRYGQLGIGNVDNQNSPQLVEDLTDVNIIQVHCGAYFSLALTSDGELFSWGHNTFAQLGDRTYNSREVPTQVLISEKIVSLSCGSNHTCALSETGRVYVWGNNTYGQLGRHPSKDIQKSRLKPMSNRPRLLEGFSNILRAVCGPNHCLILTNDGYLYAFGLNSEGQIGNGSIEDQYEPIRLNKNDNHKVKDVITFYDNEISIAVSDTDSCYIWGLVWGQNRVLQPKLVTESAERLIDIYGKYSTNKTMFKAIVVNDLDQIERSGLQFKELELVPINSISSELISSNNSKITNQLTDPKEFLTFDEQFDANLFPILNSNPMDENTRETIRLFYIYGINASNVIFATKEDAVFGFGNNIDGTLGLGTYGKHIRSPVKNKTLSGKLVIQISSGFGHCIAITKDGQCYAWGQNKYGQLGTGSLKPSNSPKIIQSLVHKKVVQICCGGYFSLALTSDGEIYSWGQNILGQLGISTYSNSWAPNLIEMKHPIVWISCGRNHASAVADIGLAYTWGHNEWGQLGREKEFDYRPARKQWIAYRPFFNSYFKNITFVKSVCGPDYTLLLTDEGYIYAFGDNTNGQIGNGKLEQQYRPVRINDDLKFKDIVTHFDNNLSIGISTDGRYYVWGLTKDSENILIPKLIPESSNESVVNIYAKYATKKVTFKTVIIEEVSKEVIQSNECNKMQNKVLKNVFLTELSKSSKIVKKVSENSKNIANYKPCPPKMFNEKQSIESNFVKHVFNDENDSDLHMVSDGKPTIYCNKSFLKARNEKFLLILMLKSSEGNENEVRINSEKYDVFYAFLQYLYGIDIQINENILYDLQSMGHHFNESKLLDICSQNIRNLENMPNLLNVCALFEKAVFEGSADLEKKCIEFAANNWKTLFKSNEFLSMNDSLSKRFMVSIFEIK